MRAHNKIEWAQRKEESNSNNNKSEGDGEKSEVAAEKCAKRKNEQEEQKKKKRMRNERRKPRMLRVKGAACLLKDERPLESCKSELTAALAAAAVGNVYR